MPGNVWINYANRKLCYMEMTVIEGHSILSDFFLRNLVICYRTNVSIIWCIALFLNSLLLNSYDYLHYSLNEDGAFTCNQLTYLVVLGLLLILLLIISCVWVWFQCFTISFRVNIHFLFLLSCKTRYSWRNAPIND